MRSNTHNLIGTRSPRDERRASLMHTTGYAVLSGYHVPNEMNARVAQRRSGSGRASRAS